MCYMKYLMCVMCRVYYVLCEGFILCYVKVFACVMCIAIQTGSLRFARLASGALHLKGWGPKGSS